jgi:hypothetical protein
LSAIIAALVAKKKIRKSRLANEENVRRWGACDGEAWIRGSNFLQYLNESFADCKSKANQFSRLSLWL